MTIQKNNIDPNIEMVGDDFVCPKENLGTSSDVAQISLNDSNFNVAQTLSKAQTIQIQLTDELVTYQLVTLVNPKPTIVWGGGDSQDGLEPDEYDNWHPHF
jgi:hypothetical protein